MSAPPRQLLAFYRSPRFTRRRHPRAQLLSQYLDGELTPAREGALKAHMHDCGRCQDRLESLTRTVEALSAPPASAPPDLAESIIAAIRATPGHGNGAPLCRPRLEGARTLTLVTDAASDAESQTVGAWPVRAGRASLRAMLRYCTRWRQLRLTLSIAVLAGVALSLTSQGNMIFDGRAGLLSICLSCAPNFLIPFLALNMALLLASGLARTRLFRGNRKRW
jgi:anti-sigma factor RsiW